MKRLADRGSSPLELVTFTALLMLPIGLSIPVYQQLSNELAAESIARHALRLSMLQNPERPSAEFESAVELFAANWGLTEVDYSYRCSSGCSLITLEIKIGSATAIQTMSLPRS